MAAPQIQEITVKVSDKVLITFDQAIDTEINVPLTSVSINYGKIPIRSWEYYGTAAMVLKIGRTLTYRDKIEVNYQPPEDINLALRAPVPANAELCFEAIATKTAANLIINKRENRMKAHDLKGYFLEIVPEFDEERVYASDIKKVIQWYNLLQGKGLVDAEEEATAEAETAEETEEKAAE